MSLLSSRSSKSGKPFEALFDEEELDYEADPNSDEEEHLKDNGDSTQLPEPSGQEFRESSSGSECSQSKAQSTPSFRDHLNYLKRRKNLNLDSRRNTYRSYLSSKSSTYLDSTDEEDGPEFNSTIETEHNGSLNSIYSRGFEIPESTYNDQEQTHYYGNSDMYPASPRGSSCFLYNEDIGDAANLFNMSTDVDSNTSTESQLSYDKNTQSSCKSNSSQKVLERKSKNTIKKNVQNTGISTGSPSSNNKVDIQSPKKIIEGVQAAIKPKNTNLNFKIQIKGNERCIVNPPVISPKPLRSADPSVTPLQILQQNEINFVQPIKPITRNRRKPFTKKHIFEEKIVTFNDKDFPDFALNLNEPSCLESVSPFKVPLKRPSSKSQSLSVSVDSRGIKTVTDVWNDKTDIISLTASSCNIEDDQEEEPILSQFKSESSPELYLDRTPDQLERVMEWLNTENISTQCTTKRKIPPVPLLYKGLCYNHFFRNNCQNSTCKNGHSLTIHFKENRNLSNLEKENFKLALDFATYYPNFYEKILPIFAEFFSFNDDKDSLMLMVHQILKDDFKINKVLALNTLLKNLQQTDLGTFKDSVEYVLSEVGLKSYKSLGIILMEIIISLDDLTSYWPIFRRLIIAGTVLRDKLAATFLLKIMKEPVDLKLCRDAYTYILKYKFINMVNINNHIREPFLKLATKSETRRSELEAHIENSLEKERSEFERSNLCMRQTFSKQMLPSISTQETNLEFPKYGGNVEYRPTQLEYLPKRNINRFNNVHSSTDESTNLARVDTYLNASCQQSNNSHLTLYNPETVYVVSSKKRKHQESQPRDINSVFDQLLQQGDSNAPPRKKVRIQPGQKSNNLNEEIDKIVVSSSCEVLPNKPPEHPVFGQLCLNPYYKFNCSLHNLFIEEIGSLDIDEHDTIKLNTTILHGNGADFLNLIEKYQCPLTVQNFISMTLAHLKSLNQLMARTWKRLLGSIERTNPHFYGSLKIRVILEVITMNLIIELDKYNSFNDIKDLLMKFTNWDSLITSRLFITDIRVAISMIGRYLFLARVLLNKKPELTYEILICPNLHLLEHCEKWPYYEQITSRSEVTRSDLSVRNNVLMLLLRHGYLNNILTTTDLYKTAKKKAIWNFDVIPYINPMIENLIDQKAMVQLKHIYQELDLFIEHINSSILRQFLIFMNGYLPAKNLFTLFEICAERRLYQKICKDQTLEENINLDSKYLPQEVEIIIKYCFYKLLELRFLPSGGFKFYVVLVRDNRQQTSPNNVNSIDKVKCLVIDYLQKYFGITGRTAPGINLVEVDKQSLINFLEEVDGKH